MTYVSRAPPCLDINNTRSASSQATSYDARASADNSTVSDEMLLLAAGVAPSAFAGLKAQADRWGVPLRVAARALGVVSSRVYLHAMSQLSGLNVAPDWSSLSMYPISPAPLPYRLLDSRLAIPLEYPHGHAILNAENFTPRQLAELGDHLDASRDRIWLVDRKTMRDAIIRAYGPELAFKASYDLPMRHPRLSAASGMRQWQILFMTVFFGLFVGAMLFTPREAMVVLCVVLTLMFSLTIALRVAAALHALYRRATGKRHHVTDVPEDELPSYTIVVAMYQEAQVLRDLVVALTRLNYPPPKLDIKLVLEEEDAETIAAARAENLPPQFEILIVPKGEPRTKPRALNYALQFARGDFLVIYDAEDRPAPNQLRVAAGHFRNASPKVVCLQARLIFDNLFENWLSKQFTIEYASLFGGILPMLDAAHLPIPLGGTSNHFRTSVLRRIGGWDAHNVTEDADLGMRLYRSGVRAEILGSTTYEEAACHGGNWLRQRTRWLKGWLQTYVVHMRQPFCLLRELGLKGFLAFQGHFAGVLIAALVHPLSYVLIAYDATTGALFREAETTIGWQLWGLAVFNFIAGYMTALALGVFVLRGKRIRKLIPQLIYIPVYWLFISAAAYRAVYQFFKAPFHWEKTKHGVTKMRRPGSRRAL
jgi:cellulose synthase/poly-beta-1,6-N-acetylglucosamine synthase-like glycosyltransferase